MGKNHIIKLTVVATATLVFVAVLVLYIWFNFGKVTIDNCSASEVLSGTLVIGKHKFKLGYLDYGEKRTIIFQIGGDSDYSIDVKLSSGKSIKKTMDHITSGFNHDDILEVLDNDIILK